MSDNESTSEGSVIIIDEIEDSAETGNIRDEIEEPSVNEDETNDFEELAGAVADITINDESNETVNQMNDESNETVNQLNDESNETENQMNDE
ncbi:hypothetical protein AVEN_45433-1, partial [Araneus ventricosus]